MIIAALPGFYVPMVLCLSGLVYWLQKKYIPLCDQLQLLEKDARLSLVTHHSDTAAGVEQIRASEQQLAVASRGLDLLDKSQICFYRRLDARRWAGFIVSFFTNAAVIAFIAVAALGCMQITSAATTGLALFVIQSFSFKLTRAVELFLSLKSVVLSLVYLLDLIKNTPPEPFIQFSDEAPRWPEIGTIQLRSVTST